MLDGKPWSVWGSAMKDASGQGESVEGTDGIEREVTDIADVERCKPEPERR